MNSIVKAFVSLLVGAVVALVMLVGLTELLAPHIWPSLMVSGPIAVVNGVVVTALTYGLLQYRDEVRAGGASPRTVAALWGLVAGTAAFVVAGTAVTLALGALSVSLFAAMLFGGVPAGLFAGAVGAASAAWYVGRRGEGGRLTASASRPESRTRSR